MANMPSFLWFVGFVGALKPGGAKASRRQQVSLNWRQRGGLQQPRQIFFSRAFISASSALIESTRAAAASAFGGGAVRNAGFAAAADAAVAATLS